MFVRSGTKGPLLKFDVLNIRNDGVLPQKLFKRRILSFCAIALVKIFEKFIPPEFAHAYVCVHVIKVNSSKD